MINSPAQQHGFVNAPAQEQEHVDDLHCMTGIWFHMISL
jgi:hypothetical protein